MSKQELNLGGLKWLLDISKVIGKYRDQINVAKIPAVLQLIPSLLDDKPPLEAPGGIEGRIDEFLLFLTEGAGISKTTVDDKWIETAKKVYDIPVVKSLLVTAVRMVFVKQAEKPDDFSFDSAAALLDLSELSKWGLDKGVFLQLVQALHAFLKAFRGQ